MVHFIDCQTHAIFIVFVICTHHEIMFVFSCEQEEVFLILLECNDIDRFLTDENHAASQEVEHHIVQFRHESLFFDFKEIDVLVLDDAELIVLLASRDETSALNAVVLLPDFHFLSFIILKFMKLDIL